MTLHNLTSPTRGASGADRPGLTHTPPASYAPVDQSPSQHRLHRNAMFVLALVLGVVDVVLIKSLFDAILLDQGWVSWLVATVIAFGATALAWSAGRSAAIAHTDQNRAHAIFAGLTGIAWVLLGVGLSWLRWHSAELTQTTVVVEGGSSAGVDAATQTHHLLAVILGTLYLMVGALAATHAYDVSDPIAARQRASHERLTTLRSQLPHDEGRATEMAILLGRHRDELTRVDQRAQNAREAAQDLADELVAFAAAEVARHLGTPWAVQGDPAAQATTPEEDAA